MSCERPALSWGLTFSGFQWLVFKQSWRHVLSDSLCLMLSGLYILHGDELSSVRSSCPACLFVIPYHGFQSCSTVGVGYGFSLSNFSMLAMIFIGTLLSFEVAVVHVVNSSVPVVVIEAYAARLPS